MCGKTDAKSPLRVPTRFVWQNLWHTLETTVRTSTFADHADSMEGFLQQIHCPLQPEFNSIRIAVESVYASAGQLRINDLAERVGLSRRQIERQFKNRVGISPKLLARIVRVEAVKKHLMEGPADQLGTIAVNLGYTDQAHFIKDFKAVVGYTPGEFALLSATNQHLIMEHQTYYAPCTLQR